MLLKTQRIDADQLVKEGKPFPADLAAAVLAAVDEATAAHHAVQFQYSEVNGLVTKYESKLDEIRRTRLELEERIDTRVNLRTEEMQKLVEKYAVERESAYERCRDADLARDRAYEDYAAARESWGRKLELDRRLIESLRQLVCDKFSPTLFSRIVWKSKAKKVLYEVQDYHPAPPVKGEPSINDELRKGWRERWRG